MSSTTGNVSYHEQFYGSKANNKTVSSTPTATLKVGTTLNLGDELPNFEVDTTQGVLKLHEYFGDGWGILFSHPADFTPVCTTELNTVAQYIPEFTKRNTKVAAISCDPVESHKEWIKDVLQYDNKATSFDYPIIADPKREIAVRLGMLDAVSKDAAGLPLTARAVFIIGPDHKLKLSILYPATTGRNFNEIIRVLDSLQLTAQRKLATPADWVQGNECVVSSSVSQEDAVKMFPLGVRIVDLPSKKPYLRMTPQPTDPVVPSSSAPPSATTTTPTSTLPAQGGLNLGDEIPNFEVETTQGKFKYHEYLGDSWGILFSHPRDFTPVCTTELSAAAKKVSEFTARNVKLAALSCDPVESHQQWISDVVAYDKSVTATTLPFPIIADPKREIAVRLGMLDAVSKDELGVPLTARAVFIIGPDKKLKLSLLYPATTGRNFDEIIRVVDSLQLTAFRKLATPANWIAGTECVVASSVSQEEAPKLFPLGVRVVDLPSKKPYLRFTPDPR